MTVARDTGKKAFYNSEAWKKCRESYLKKQCYICERCGAPAVCVHHKIRVNASTLQKPEVLLNFDNLVALCFACHQKEHEEERRQGRRRQAQENNAPDRFFIDESGRVYGR